MRTYPTHGEFMAANSQENAAYHYGRARAEFAAKRYAAAIWHQHVAANYSECARAWLFQNAMPNARNRTR